MKGLSIGLLILGHMTSNEVSGILISGRHHKHHHKQPHLAQHIEHAPQEGQPGHDAILKADSHEGDRDCFYPLKNGAGDVPPDCIPRGKPA